MRGGSYHSRYCAHQLASGPAIIDAKRNVRRYIGGGPGAKHTALNVVELKYGVRFFSHESWSFSIFSQ